MIRVFSGITPLSSNLNSFHKTAVVSDGKFALNAASSTPPPVRGGVFGVDKADPQPTYYPTNTTFFARVSASKPLLLSSNVGTAYFIITPGLGNGNNISIQAFRGYSGGVKKVFSNDTLPEFPLDPSLFVDPPRGVYYLRVFDETDQVATWQDTSTMDAQRFVALVPASLGLTTPDQLSAYRGVVRRIRIDVDKTTIKVELVDKLNLTPYMPWDSDVILANNELILEIIETA